MPAGAGAGLNACGWRLATCAAIGNKAAEGRLCPCDLYIFLASCSTCRSRLAGEPVSSLSTCVSDPPRSPASRLLQWISAAPIISEQNNASITQALVIKRETPPPFTRRWLWRAERRKNLTSSQVEAVQVWHVQTCRSRLAGEPVSSVGTCGSDPPRSPASRLLQSISAAPIISERNNASVAEALVMKP